MSHKNDRITVGDFGDPDRRAWSRARCTAAEQRRDVTHLINFIQKRHRRLGRSRTSDPQQP